MERQRATTKVAYHDDFSKALIESAARYLGEEGIPSLQKKGNEDDFSKKDPKAKAAPADPAISIAAGTGVKQSHGAEVEYTTVRTKNVQREETELEEGKNKEGKEQGSDGKACWKGYKYAGTENGKDKCVKMKEDADECEYGDEEEEDKEDKKKKKEMKKEEVTLKQIVEKAVSKSQQRFMGMVHATKKGEAAPSKEVAKAAKSMTGKEAEKFAATKHKGLPEKKTQKEEYDVETAEELWKIVGECLEELGEMDGAKFKIIGEKMDAVGKEDSDVNNDGKVDKQDKFLKGRREKVSKIIAAKKKVDEMIALEQEIIAEKKM